MSERDLFDNMEPKMVREFRKYHSDNPHIYVAFRRYAWQAIDRGRRNIGAGLICERIRWDTALSGNDEFKLNNNFRAFYARMFMREFPQHDGFFRTRASAADTRSDG